MAKNLFLDTETCGLHGLPVIVQYAIEDGPISIHNFWTKHVDDSIKLIEFFLEYNFIGFNIAFDWFQLSKMYTFLLEAKLIGVEYPDEWLDTTERKKILADCEERGRDGPCIKPVGAFDIMLHARKTEFQKTMERKDIRIKRVPTPLAWQLAKKLNDTIVFDDILFARVKDKLAPRFKVMDCKDFNGSINPDFKNILLKFKASTALKALAAHVLHKEDILLHSDIAVNKKFLPREYGYAPYANVVPRCPKGKTDKQKYRIGAWPEVIKYHIDHWSTNETAQRYAKDDIDYTRDLYKYFKCPEPNDDDSALAIMVAIIRWRGFAIDLEGLKLLRAEAIEKRQSVPRSAKQVKAYLFDALNPKEKLILENSKLKSGTAKVILQEISKWIDHPAAKRAQNVLDARFAGQEILLYDKLIAAGRLHASVNVIGSLSGRMSGGDGLNPLGINKTKKVRSKFPLAFGHLKGYGGDFAGFEVVLADASYNDPVLRRDLLTCEKCRNGQQVEFINGIKYCPKCKRYSNICFICGKDKYAEHKDHKPDVCTTMKVHGLFGMDCYPGMTYDEIVATSGKEIDLYTRAKSGLFALIYFGNSFTLQTRLGVDIDAANAAFEKFIARCKGVGRSRRRVENMFLSMRQVAGIGSRIEWNEPADYIESLFGFRRYFTLENMICKALYNLANDPPKEWLEIKIKVMRRDRLQTVTGAVRTALFAAAFAIQGQNTRAAGNHEIQSTGAQITKHLQRKIWDLQAIGVNELVVQPLSIHDEVLVPTRKDYEDKLKKTVKETIESYRNKIPLIEMEFGEMDNWGEK